MKIEFGIPQRKVKEMLSNAYDDAWDEGWKCGADSAVASFRHRVSLLNEDFPVSVAELRNWFGMTKDGK